MTNVAAYRSGLNEAEHPQMLAHCAWSWNLVRGGGTRDARVSNMDGDGGINDVLPVSLSWR